MSRLHLRIRLLVGLFVMANLCLSAGCTTFSGPARDASLTATLARVLTEQAAAWNRGDIDAFVDDYWKSPDLTFSSGGATTRGWEATRDRYHKRYPDRAAMGTLTFDSLEAMRLDANSALLLGRWKLVRAADSPGGNFSLVFRRIDGRWLIVHDHTSLSPTN